MKIEIFIGRKSVQSVSYCRMITVPVKYEGKMKSLVINLKFVAFWFYF